MSQSLADIILHIVFSTKDKHPWILPCIEQELFQYICGVARQIDSPIIKINGVEDHVHILLHLGRTITTSKLVSELKSSSSRWIMMKNIYGIKTCRPSRPHIFFLLKLRPPLRSA